SGCRGRAAPAGAAVMSRGVVITGLGVVAPNGIGREAFLRALEEGTSGIDEIRGFDTRGYAMHRGGEVKDLESVDSAFAARRARRTTAMMTVAIREALADAGLSPGAFDPDRIGVLLGTTSGEVQDMEAIDEAWTLGRPDSFTVAAYAGFCSNSITSRLASTF